ncbi:MAG: PfkB family carbohydrate kinase [Pseudomonadota bacterium]
MKGPTVVAISSHVMAGTVGLRAIGFALERRGHTVWSVPTVVMPWHPGMGRSTRTIMADLPMQLGELATRAEAVDGVLTGYFATAEQVEAAARFVDALRAVRPDALVVTDPVTGDENGRYVPDSVAEAIVTHLLPRADVATPNRNELMDLSGGADLQAARGFGPKASVVTSAVAANGALATWLVEAEVACAFSHRKVQRAARGTGDLFSAILTSGLLHGASREAAVAAAAAATLSAVEASGPDALNLSAVQAALASPDTSSIEKTPI